MAAYKGGVFVAQGHVNRRAQPTHFFCRRYQRRAFFNRFAQRRAELGVQDGRRVLQLARFAHDGCLAVTLRGSGRNAQRMDAFVAQQLAQLFADGNQLIQVL